ncbi:MAG: biotin--[acetyl-CoA-carboxylase] ligase, partial [Clostridia bacterium]|nr:biotin--[acetyl-CoA-carboxylase] ligase [Clostridia bacterium]
MEQEIRWLLENTAVMGRNILYFEELDSTNTYAKELALTGAPEGTVVIADCQTAGRGRMNRSFQSPKG